MREAEKGRRKAEVEAAQLRVEVEAQRRRGDDLQQRRGFAEAQVRTLTSTWCSIQVVRPQGTDTMSLHAHLRVGCSVLGRGAEPPQFWVLLIWLEPGISHVTWVHYDATMCLACFVCSILPVLHFLRFDLCVL